MFPCLSIPPFNARTFAAVAFGLVTFSSVLSPDRLLLFPTTGTLPAPGATRRSIPFRGGQLEIWTARTARCRSGVPSTWLRSPVMTMRVPSPMRVRNIFICMAVVFCASSRMA